MTFCLTLAFKYNRSEDLLLKMIDIYADSSIAKTFVAARYNENDQEYVHTDHDDLLITSLICCSSDASILHLMQLFPDLASLAKRDTKMLPIYIALSSKRSLSVVFGLMICCPLIGSFDQTLCKRQVKTATRVAITKSLSFWNTFASKFEEGESLTDVIEEVKDLLENKIPSDSTNAELRA